MTTDRSQPWPDSGAATLGESGALAMPRQDPTGVAGCHRGRPGLPGAVHPGDNLAVHVAVTRAPAGSVAGRRRGGRPRPGLLGRGADHGSPGPGTGRPGHRRGGAGRGRPRAAGLPGVLRGPWHSPVPPSGPGRGGLHHHRGRRAGRRGRLGGRRRRRGGGGAGPRRRRGPGGRPAPAAEAEAGYFAALRRAGRPRRAPGARRLAHRGRPPPGLTARPVEPRPAEAAVAPGPGAGVSGGCSRSGRRPSPRWRSRSSGWARGR